MIYLKKSSHTLHFLQTRQLFRAIQNLKDIDGIQKDITKLTEWSIRWQLMFNDGKCKVVHYGKNNPKHQYMIKGEPLNTDMEETDLGITFEEGFTFSKHVAKIAAKANSRLGLIHRHLLWPHQTNFQNQDQKNNPSTV